MEATSSLLHPESAGVWTLVTTLGLLTATTRLVPAVVLGKRAADREKLLVGLESVNHRPLPEEVRKQRSSPKGKGAERLPSWKSREARTDSAGGYEGWRAKEEIAEATGLEEARVNEAASPASKMHGVAHEEEKDEGTPPPQPPPSFYTPDSKKSNGRSSSSDRHPSHLPAHDSDQDQERLILARLASRMNARPADETWITLTYAQSLDGKIGVWDEKEHRCRPTRLSGDRTMKMTHHMRAMHDAIAVGVDTIISDDPQLTTRLVLGPSPRPVIVDPMLRCPTSARVLSARGKDAPGVVVLCTPEVSWDAAMQFRAEALRRSGAVVFPCRDSEFDADTRRIHLRSALKTAGKRLGFTSVMMEGGARIIGSMLAAPSQSSYDALIVTLAPVFLGEVGVPVTTDVVPPLNVTGTWRVGPDVVLMAEQPMQQRG